MVVTAHKLASDIGLSVLKKGGNAFDAAIAVNYALAICYPRAGNLAGGGFMVFRTANGDVGTLDYREKAPNRAHRDMYLDSNHNLIDSQSVLGGLAVAVPGTVAGMEAIYEKFGTLSKHELLQPSIQLAQKGFVVNHAQALKWNQYREMFVEVNSDSIPLVKESKWQEGDTLKLPELVQTLELIAKQGESGFYEGYIAELIVKSLGDEGILTLDDLKSYDVVWRKALSFDYKGYKIHSMAPPSSGGIALAQLFRGIERSNFDSIALNSSEYIHFLTELERRVYADRATHLGDPDFIKVPVSMLLDSIYIDERNETIKPCCKTDSKEIKAGDVEIIESNETTHFSIVDAYGNAVSITTTLNSNFGSKVYVNGGGFFLNNEMDDFSSKPGVANQFGLVGAEANAIEADKRMLSSMSPTIIEKNGSLFMVLGSPGGSTIITSVFQTILNIIEYGLPVNKAVNNLKTHAQWMPDKIYYEAGLDSIVLNELQSRGHELRQWDQIGKMAVIHKTDQGELFGSADENRSFGSVAQY